MKFETARTVVRITLIAAAVFCVLSLILRSGEPVIANRLLLVGAVCMALCMFFTFAGLKCPYCGKHIISNSMHVTICPHCRRDLKSGLKVKHGIKK